MSKDLTNPNFNPDELNDLLNDPEVQALMIQKKKDKELVVLNENLKKEVVAIKKELNKEKQKNSKLQQENDMKDRRCELIMSESSLKDNIIVELNMEVAKGKPVVRNGKIDKVIAKELKVYVKNSGEQNKPHTEMVRGFASTLDNKNNKYYTVHTDIDPRSKNYFSQEYYTNDFVIEFEQHIKSLPNHGTIRYKPLDTSKRESRNINYCIG